jgi:hypothetical protein
MNWWKQDDEEWINLDQVVKAKFQREGDSSQGMSRTSAATRGLMPSGPPRKTVYKLFLYLSDGHTHVVLSDNAIQEVAVLLKIEVPSAWLST